MTKSLADEFRPTRLLRALREVISALDRRKPQVNRPGETSVAADAQRLRRQAVARLQQLTGTGSGANAYDQDLVESIMTDDGGSQPERRLNR